MSTNNFSLINKVKKMQMRTLQSVLFADIKNTILGEDYDLSIVFIDDKEARAINIKHRGKNYIPNVLSFELEKTAGEIFINPIEARRQAKDFGRTPSNMIAFLYIHALCHLKGMQHGSTMERTEAKFRKVFGI